MVPARKGRRRAGLGAAVVASAMIAAAVLVTPASAEVDADVDAQVGPPVTAAAPRPLPSVPGSATTTTPPTVPPTTAVPTTVPASTTVPPTTSVPPSGSTTTTAPTTTTVHTTTTKPGAAAKAPATSATTVAAAPSGPPPASLSTASVTSYLAGLAHDATYANSSSLLNALRPLQDYGLSPDQVAAMGMGRFPVAGLAYYRDDFHEPRTTPEPHLHQGNDVFTAYGTPVRSPADGVLRYATEVVGGNVAYVTEPGGTWYYLAHLQGFVPGLASGAAVQVGEILGYAGDTGDAKGGPPHVHFEIHPGGGDAVDPKPILDGWLADALAAVPGLLAPYHQDVSGPLTAIAVSRHLDASAVAMPVVVSEPSRGSDWLAAQRLAAAVLDPLTPVALRS